MNKLENFFSSFDLIPNLIVILEKNGNIEFVNKFGLKLLGYKEEELFNKNWFDMCIPKYIRTKMKKTFANILAGDVKKYEYFENEIITKFGKKLLIAWHNSYLNDPSGKILKILSSGLDITKQRKVEESLKIKNIFFNEAQSSNSISDTNGIILDANPAFLKYTGFSKKEEVIGKHVSKFFYYSGDSKKLLRLLAKTGRWSGKIIAKRKNGSKFLIYGAIACLRNNEGKLIGYQSSMYDITEQEKYAEDLRKSEELFRGTFEKSGVPKVMLSPEGKFIRVNNAFVRLLGYSFEELKKKDFKDITYSEDLKISQDSIKILLSGKSNFYHFEKRYIHKSGRIIWVDISTTLIRDKEGRPLYFITNAIDISKQKKAEVEIKKYKNNLELLVKSRTLELEKQKTFFNSIVENIPDMIFVKDAKDLKFELFNKAGEKLLGQNRKTLFGKNDYDFFPKKQADFFTGKDREVLENKRLLDIPEEPIKTPSGERILHTKKIPILNKDGNPEFLLGISEDITQKKVSEENLKKAYEKLMELDKMKNQFLAFTSHELKTPLTPILIQAQMLREGDMGQLSEEQKISLDLIVRNMRNLNQLIGDVLDVATIQNNSLKIIMEKFNINSIILESIENMQPFANEKKIKIESKFDKISEFYFDPRRIKQVMENLLSNAIKFSHEKGKISVFSEVRANQVLISVRDNGVGITQENQDKIFQPFVQIVPSYQKKQHGTGLGLAICKGILEAHGGKISVKSQYEKGSEFFFTLPIRTKPLEKFK
jgi:PAS domain S-box-containing protein